MCNLYTFAVRLSPPSLTLASTMTIALQKVSNDTGSALKFDLPACTHYSGIDLKPCIASLPTCDDRTTNGIADERSNGDDGEDGSSPHSDLPYV